MPVWSVSEPNISLWILDEPLGYQPVVGPRISFELSFKQRESYAGWDTNIFSAGKKWNLSWHSYVFQDAENNFGVHFPGGGRRFFYFGSDYLSNSQLTGSPSAGFTNSFPDGSQDVYGFIVTNSSGVFQKAFLTERRNSASQATRLYYSSYTPGAAPVIRLDAVVDGDGRTNRIYYVGANNYSTNLISHVVDPFGRTNFLAYDDTGHLTNITDVAGIPSSLGYDASDSVTNLTTPYGTTTFTLTESTGANIAPNGRSILVTQPDGGRQLYLYTNSAPGIAGSYASNEVPNTAPFTNTFDTTNLHVRNSFHWSPRQYAALSSTNLPAFTANDFRKARMQHWLATGTRVGQTRSLERQPSPDPEGNIEGQKTWYDHPGKVLHAGKFLTAFESESRRTSPLFVAQVLPDGSTAFTRSQRNSFGAVTNAVSTYSAGGAVLPRTNVFVYDSTGIDLLRATNALGIQVSSNAYNAYGQILTNYNALGEKTTYTYDSSQRLIRVISPTGLVVTNIYDSDGLLAQEIVIGFSTNSYAYTNGLVWTHTDARGLTVTNTYDGLQRLRRMDYPDGTFVTNSYDKLDLVRVVDRMGSTNSFGYDSMRRRVAETNALGFYTLYNYCNCGSLDSVRDAAGNYTYFTYDNTGRRVASAFPDGYAVTNKYDALGRITNTVDSAGMSTTNWFNHQGLIVTVSNAWGRVASYTYDLEDRATNSVDANGVSVNVTYDSLGRIRTRSYPDGGIEGFGYTQNVSAMTTYTNQLGKVTWFAYDVAGRQTAETNANNEITQFGYSGPGDLLALTDGKNQVTRWNYDPFGRATNKVDAASNEIFRYAYDQNNRLTNRWTPAKGNTVYRYDAAGNLTNVNHSVGTGSTPSVTLRYDALNRLTNMVDGVGATAYSYTSAGQLLSEDGPWSDDTVSYTYQNRLRASLSLQAPNASAWQVSYGYDAAKRLANVTSPAGAFAYAYKAGQASSLSQLALPGGSYITNDFDTLGRLLSTTMKNSVGSVLNSHAYGYNLGNQRTQQVFTAANYVNYSYDDIGQLKAAIGKESGGTTNRQHEQLGYTYDAAGNLNYRTNNALLQTFNVNNLNELSTVTRGGTLTVAGTTTSQATNVTVNSLLVTLYGDATFAREGFPLVDSTTNFTAIAEDSYGRWDTNTVTVDLRATNTFVYDLNGNLRTNGSQVLEYDDENQVTAVTVSNSWRSEFAYDGKMRRRTTREYAWVTGAWNLKSETRYLYDGMLVVQERDANNLPQVSYTRGRDLSGDSETAGGIGGMLARSRSGGSTVYAHILYHADGNGNITGLASTNGILLGRYYYDPYGNTLSLDGVAAEANLYRFSSKEWHAASGFYYYGYRFYAPEIQRWLNRDPIGESGGINLFTFTANMPTVLVDSIGLQVDRAWNFDPRLTDPDAPVRPPAPKPAPPAPTPTPTPTLQPPVTPEPPAPPRPKPPTSSGSRSFDHYSNENGMECHSICYCKPTWYVYETYSSGKSGFTLFVLTGATFSSEGCKCNYAGIYGQYAGTVSSFKGGWGKSCSKCPSPE